MSIKENKFKKIPKLNNKDVIQSYIVTSARYDFSVHEKRILYRIIEANQSMLNNKRLRDKYIIQTDLFDGKIYTMHVNSFLNGEDDKNHKRIKEAFMSLENKGFIYEDESIIKSIRLVRQFQIHKRSQIVNFTLDAEIYTALMDFSKGYKKFELVTAMQFESVYAMRFYELMSGQKTKIEYSIDKLKEMFNIEGKYKQVNDFIKKVIIAAKNELDKKSPYTFDFLPQKHGRKITSILFIPIYQSDKRDPEVEKKSLKRQVSPSWDLTKNTIDYLKYSFDFTIKEIKQNIELFVSAENKIDLVQFMANIKPRANRANNPKGYLINALKIELKINE